MDYFNTNFNDVIGYMPDCTETYIIDLIEQYGGLSTFTGPIAIGKDAGLSGQTDFSIAIGAGAGKLGVKSGEGFYDYSESKKAEKVANMFLKN
jgi:hypothetical protein